MHGQHARSASTLFGPAPEGETPPPEQGGPRHSRGRRLTGRLRRRLLAYREIEFLSSRAPGDHGPGEDSLLLVHIRKVVGQVHYRICTHCAEAVITGVVIEERFHATGLGTRALSHLRSRYPDMTWRSTLDLRTTRGLMRRMRIPVTTADELCSHTRNSLSDPALPAS